MKYTIHVRKGRGHIPALASGYCVPSNATFREIQANLKPLERRASRALRYGAAK